MPGLRENDLLRANFRSGQMATASVSAGSDPRPCGHSTQISTRVKNLARNDHLQSLFDGIVSSLTCRSAGTAACGGHFVMEPDDGEPTRRTGVLGTKYTCVVLVYV